MHSFVPLSPTTFLERSGRVYANRKAILLENGDSISFGGLLSRTRKLSQVLNDLKITYGDKVAILSENKHQTIECNFAIPSLGAVIVSLNPWLPTKDIISQIKYCEAKVLIVSDYFLQLHQDIMQQELGVLHIIIIDPSGDKIVKKKYVNVLFYETCLEQTTENGALDKHIRSELDPIAINFTSGTAGSPKGVVFSHRAAYLHAMGQVLMLSLTYKSRYLWSLPMFHVNGWGHIWSNIAVAATQIILGGGSKMNSNFLEQITKFQVSHLAGAPRLVRSLIDETGDKSALSNCTIVTGGAAPSPHMIKALEDLKANLIHQYGLNETCGPFVVCECQDDWQDLSQDERVKIKLRQGVAAIHAGTGLRVVDSRMQDVPADGSTLGEVIMAGNTVALEYYKNEDATQKAFVDGWFRSGDMAVMHPNAYLEIKDRIKDLIYVETEYGWENISSIEVENIIGKHPAVKDVAVVGLVTEEKGKENTLLIAYIEKYQNKQVEEQGLREYCEGELALYKRPNLYFFTEIPKTATGKIRKDLIIKDVSNRIVSAML